MIHDYEKRQKLNFITSFLHSTRYKNLRRLFDRVSEERGKKQIRVVDIGCGCAEAFNLLDKHYCVDYVGIELATEYCEIAVNRYGDRSNFRLICDTIESHYNELCGADVVIGLESFEHIPETLVVRVVEAIARTKPFYFYCTVPNELGMAIFVKNVGSAIMGYKRYKEYTWKETFWATVYDLDKVGLHGTFHKGFDWRWLAQTIRHNMKIEKITKSPFQWIPRFVSPSIGFVCVVRE